MAIYLSLEMADELVKFAENDSIYEDAVKAMASAILNHYSLLSDGFSVSPEQNRINNCPDFILRILRIQRRFSGDRSVVDHTVAEATSSTDNLDEAMDQLGNALENANTEFGRCWALMVRGPDFMFYEYHANLPVNQRLVPWGPATEPNRNVFHARHNCVAIDWMLRHMQTHNTPQPR
ncbi:hypothetical protein BJX99DRAFT_260940 [Aspergillus californicus]